MGRGRELRQTHSARQAFDATHRNRAVVEASTLCGCITCGNTIEPVAITRWNGGDDTNAVCPFCGVEAVIGDASGLPLTKEFLAEARAYWSDTRRVRRLER